MARASVWRCSGYEARTRVASRRRFSRIAGMKQKLSLSSQLGPILRGARKAASLSQADLAKRTGLSQKRVSSLELDPCREVSGDNDTVPANKGVSASERNCCKRLPTPPPPPRCLGTRELAPRACCQTHISAASVWATRGLVTSGG
jgi:DNA-binding XRE family transcriptional regulator